MHGNVTRTNRKMDPSVDILEKGCDAHVCARKDMYA